jgi:transposase
VDKSIVAADPDLRRWKIEMRSKWFVGIDWGSENHQVCVLDRDGKFVSEKQISHTGSDIAGLCSWFEELSGGQLEEVHVAIETPHGAVVETLLDRGAIVYAINPKQLDRFRDRFTVAGAKDDRRDAWVLADSLRTDQGCFKRLELESATLIELREWSRMIEDLTQERTRLGNRTRQQLRRYYPQMLELTDDVAAEWFLRLWEKAPTPAKASRVRQTTVAAIFKEHRIRRHTAADALKTLRQKPLEVSPGTLAAATAHIGTVVARLRLVNEQLGQAYRRVDELCEELLETDDESGWTREQRDISILRSLPGIGRIVLTTLLAEAAGPLHDRDYHALLVSRVLCHET